MKYLYKYVYKGHDRASISLERDASEIINEPKEYLDARYVAASEACWRIFGFPMHHNQPYVIRLQLHLPNEQYVHYNPETETAEQVLHREGIHITTLTAFFDACCNYPQLASDLLYPDFPTRFTWHGDEKRWLPRKKGVVIGRSSFGRRKILSPHAFV